MGRELLVVAILVLVSDIITKALVTMRVTEGQSMRVGRWLSIRHVVNRGRSQQSIQHPQISTFILAAAMCGLYYIARQGYFFQRPAAQAGLGAAIGGAIGNLYDRLRSGSVIDFIDFGWWPVFNIADIGITLGAIISLIFMR